jgi:hypothetical protein
MAISLIGVLLKLTCSNAVSSLSGARLFIPLSSEISSQEYGASR